MQPSCPPPVHTPHRVAGCEESQHCSLQPNGTAEKGMLSILPSAARQGAELEGLGAAREADCEGKAQHSGRRSLEGEFLQQGSEEDEELSPGQLLTRTGTLAWKRSKENHTQSRV